MGSRQTTSILSRMRRPVDIACRLGNEENNISALSDIPSLSIMPSTTSVSHAAATVCLSSRKARKWPFPRDFRIFHPGTWTGYRRLQPSRSHSGTAPPSRTVDLPSPDCAAGQSALAPPYPRLSGATWDLIGGPTSGTIHGRYFALVSHERLLDPKCVEQFLEYEIMHEKPRK